MLPSTMIPYVLLVLVCLKGKSNSLVERATPLRCVCCTLAVSGCTSGFMQLALVKKRAEKITSGKVVSGNKLDHELRVVPGLNFICSGTISSLMLGADIRAIGGNRDEYPEIQIWRGAQQSIFGFVYLRQSRTDITLTEGNSSPNGVLQYNPTTPISFQSGDILGVYQPPEIDSVVRLFYIDDSSAPVANFRNNSNAALNVISPSLNPSTISNHHVLILPITGKINNCITIINGFYTDPPGCTSVSFYTPEELRQNTLEVNINGVVVRDQQQRVFPDITFTCNGSITKWIVGAGTGGGSSPPSELQIWRRSGSDYTKVGSTQLTAQNSTNNSNVYEYIPSQPLGFQEGDILGVYQSDDSSIVPYFQENTGPENLRQSNLVNAAPVYLTAPSLEAEFDYPLVTVEIGNNYTSTFIECRGEPELIYNSIIKLIIKHQQYLSTDLFSRSFTLMFNSLVSLCSALSTDLFSRSFTLMFNSLVSLCSALSTDLATRARTLFFCSLTARSSVAVSPSVCSVVAAIFRLCR